MLAFGILLVIVSLFALAFSFSASLATVVVLGVLLLVAGVIEIIESFSAGRWRGFALHFLVGLLTSVVGFLMLARPGMGVATLTIFLALLFLSGGAARISLALVERYPGWGWDVFSGLVSVLLGGFVFARWPTSALWFLGTIVGVELLVRGTMWIAFAFTLRNFRHRPTIVGPSEV